jgi:hypothetical protein
MTYQYQKLSHDSLRLLHAERISSFPRTRTPSYTAVSYTWGDDQPNQIICVNERPFPVRCNLWSLLYYFSHDALKEPQVGDTYGSTLFALTKRTTWNVMRRFALWIKSTREQSPFLCGWDFLPFLNICTKLSWTITSRAEQWRLENATDSIC